MLCNLPVGKFPVSLGNIIPCGTRERMQEAIPLSLRLKIKVMLTSVRLLLGFKLVIKLEI